MSKGGKSVETTIPKWLEEAAIRNLNQADRVSRTGPVPLSYGPTVAAFTPAQESAFSNTANLASSYGLDATTGTNISGGMDAPTTFANGVRGYSALPLYNQTMEDFRLDRPGQASYIDSFFIDPFTGSAGSMMPSTISNGVAPGLSNSGGGVRDDEPFLDPNNRIPDFRPVEEIMVGDKIYDANARATDYFGETPGNLNLIAGDLQNIGIAAAKGSKPFGIGDASYDIGGVNNEFNNPSLGTVLANEPAGYLYDPETGTFNAKGFKNTDTTVSTSVRPPTRGTDKSDLPTTKGDGSCVIATHAVASGAYNYKTLRQAEVWCMRKLHNRWWGETIRRGYRHLGRGKIAQGKAQEHYDEFQTYIDFATGKKRTLKGALTFTLRSFQFFCVGIFKRSA
tara:strand:+ start:1551 stop:2735 length:1185 start_codon:yes stop_codon:yes gene_type:complete